MPWMSSAEDPQSCETSKQRLPWGSMVPLYLGDLEKIHFISWQKFGRFIGIVVDCWFVGFFFFWEELQDVAEFSFSLGQGDWISWLPSSWGGFLTFSKCSPLLDVNSSGFLATLNAFCHCFQNDGHQLSDLPCRVVHNSF